MTKEQLRLRRRAAKKRYYEKHRERLIDDSVRWYRENKERRKRWWKKHYAEKRKQYIAKTKAWRQANPERARELDRKYVRKWQRENREKYLASKRKSRYKLKFGITIEQYDAMLEKQDGRCGICRSKNVGKPGAKHFAVDHSHRT